MTFSSSWSMRSVSVLAQLRMHLVQQQPSGFMTSPSCSSESSAGFESESSCWVKSAGVVSGSDTAASVAEESTSTTLGFGLDSVVRLGPHLCCLKKPEPAPLLLVVAVLSMAGWTKTLALQP